MVYHGSHQDITAYQDGNKIGTHTDKTVVAGTKPTANGQSIIGKREKYISMYVDEIKMYNRQLS